MENVLGKSDGSSLLDHIESCLEVYLEIKRTLPLLPKVAKLDNFWDLLFCALYFHDWGKCHIEFQKELKNIRPNYWNKQRHEIYSIPFIYKLELSKDNLTLIRNVVLGHHKSFSELSKKYKSSDDLKIEYELKWKRDKKYPNKFHPEDYQENLKYNLNYEYLHFLIKEFNRFNLKYTKNRNIKLSKQVAFDNIDHPLQLASEYFKNFTERPDNPAYWRNILLWGATKICDHYGSAHIHKINYFTKNDFSYLENLKNDLIKKKLDFYYHQKRCFDTKGNCILIAPTGSGKTEASIGWLKSQVSECQGRAYYVLPYTASINAMHKRLIKNFSSEKGIDSHNLIGIQHGKLTQYIVNFYEEMDLSSRNLKTSANEIKKLKDLYKKMIYPLKIVTPFQLLKYFYGVKGFEMGLTELVGAKLIFDEIHAYDVITFAQIVTSLEYLIDYLHCNVMIMTATLPTFLLSELQKVLKVNEPIKANQELLTSFDRHRVEIIEGTIFNCLDKIKNYYLKNKRIIIVCNTVKNAQEIYSVLIDYLAITSDFITLLHSRFNSKDRSEKETRALYVDNRILIGTQAIEVSLDIDYDVMFTEPAPLDALFQRFGRINRRRKKEISPIYISKLGSEYDHYIYPKVVIDRTLDLLSQLNIVHEEKLQQYLDFVYPDWDKEQYKEYTNTKIGFKQSLNSLQSYIQHKENEEAFYEKFDGIQVLPVQYLGEYKKYIEQYEYIDAESLLVTIHRSNYFRLKSKGIIDNHIFLAANTSGVDRNYYVTIAKCRYDPEIGMTNEKVMINDDNNMI